jgi:GxxExxY protein
MQPLFHKADDLTETIIAAASEVHRDKGPRLVESIHERCLLRELELRPVPASNPKLVAISRKGFTREEPLRFEVRTPGRKSASHQNSID